MRYLISLIIFVASCSNVKAQENDSLPYKNLKIYGLGKKYEYRAVYIDTNGDTLSNERIVVETTGKQSPLQKTQAVVNYLYDYNSRDSIKLATQPINETKFTKKWNTIQWRRSVPEGVIEDESGIWIHPFRINQYSLTEIAPFPEVKFPMAKGREWKSLMFIGKGWGTFRGRKRGFFTVGEQQTRSYSFGDLGGCWEVNATSNHKLGKNTFTYYFHTEYGFTEMYYSFYNGQKISFILEEVSRR